MYSTMARNKTLKRKSAVLTPPRTDDCTKVAKRSLSPLESLADFACQEHWNQKTSLPKELQDLTSDDAKKVTEHYEKCFAELKQQYATYQEEVNDIFLRNTYKYDKLNKSFVKCNKLLQSMREHGKGFDFSSVYEMMDGYAISEKRNGCELIAGDIIMVVKKSALYAMGLPRSPWERVYSFLVVSATDKWNIFKCKQLPTRDSKGTAVYYNEISDFDASKMTWKFLKTRVPVNGVIVDVLKDVREGETMPCAYPNWMDNGKEDPVWDYDDEDNVIGEQFTRATITQIRGLRMFANWESDTFQFFGEIGLEHLLQPFSYADSMARIFVEEHHKDVNLDYVPYYCWECMNNAHAAMYGELSDMCDMQDYTGCWTKGEDLSQQDLTQSKFSWTGKMILAEKDMKILHLTHDTDEGQVESVTVILKNFKTVREWIHFDGTSTTFKKGSVIERKIIGGFSGTKIYMQEMQNEK